MIKSSVLAIVVLAVMAPNVQAQSSRTSSATDVTAFDVNRDGVVSKGEFAQTLGPQLSATQEFIFSKRDRNHDGALTASELSASAAQVGGTSVARPALKPVDQNSDGSISLNEFTGALPASLQPAAAVMFQRFDQDGDGHVAKAEF